MASLIILAAAPLALRLTGRLRRGPATEDLAILAIAPLAGAVLGWLA